MVESTPAEDPDAAPASYYRLTRVVSSARELRTTAKVDRGGVAGKMIDPVIFPLFATAFARVAGTLLHKAAEEHIENFFGKALDALAAKGKKDPRIEVMERAYA